MAWELIKGMGWKLIDKRTDLANIQRKAFTEYGTMLMKELEDFARSKVSLLYQAVENYEKYNEELDIFSDDGFNDVCYHVVGLGYDAFTNALNAPHLLESRYTKGNYSESFAYCFHAPEPETNQSLAEVSACLSRVANYVGCMQANLTELAANVKIAQKNLNR